MEHNERSYEHVVSTQQAMLAQLAGLQRVVQLNLSDESKATVQAQIGRHRQRLALLDAVVAAYAALEADGYPELPISPSALVTEELANTLQAQQGQIRQQLTTVADELSQVQALFAISRRRGLRDRQEPAPEEGATSA